jgi:hypothetical protein
MRSSEMPVHGEYEIASSLDPLIPGAGTSLACRYADLAQQHHDLDYMICALSEQAGCDELLVARLKKRKLRLKDEIARVVSDLRTTGDAAAHP